MPEKISELTTDSAINLALDTISKKKQALIFVNTKRSAEKLAEETAKKIKQNEAEQQKKYDNLSEKAKSALSRPTKQCERLAFCLSKGIAFHHAGLAASQRELIEDNFRNNTIPIICCTPTLAYGLDLPAYRVIIRDLKRYGHRGLDWIPVLDYLQQSGRAGRPKYDKLGESVIVTKTKTEKDAVTDMYINGVPEDIFSKLAVEPALRTYVLSLIASNLVNSKATVLEFFERTFWAYQFRDMARLERIIEKMLVLLEEWEFIQISNKSSDFVSADEVADDRIRATMLGKRIAELYVDPLTAHFFIECLRKASAHKFCILKSFPLLQVISHTLEMRPVLRVRSSDYDSIEDFLNIYVNDMLEAEPSAYEPEYEDYLASVKTAMFMHSWIEEKDEQYLLETFNIRPGEIKVKLNIGDWLLYVMEEILRILQFHTLRKDIVKTRQMLKYGVKEELLPLLRLKQVGRVRARLLFNNKIRTVADVKKADLMKMSQLLGKQTALTIKKQVDQNIEPVKDSKRKGQLGLGKY